MHTWVVKFTGPFRDAVWNAWWNITICGILVVGGLTFVLRDGDEPFAWAFLVGTSCMEVLFIYSLFTARREGP